MMLFFMLSSALRAAGDARTPLRLGVTMTLLNLVLNLLLIPRLGTAGSALGTVIASSTVSAVALYMLFKGKLVIRFSRDMDFRPDWSVIRSLFRFGLPDRRAGHRDEPGRRHAAPLHRRAGAERCGAGGLRDRLHRAVLAHHLDLGRPDGRGGDRRRAEPGRGSAGARHPGRAHRVDDRLVGRRRRRPGLRRGAAAVCWRCSARPRPRWRGLASNCCDTSPSPASSSPSPSHTLEGCRGPATRAARCSSRWRRRLRCRWACAPCIEATRPLVASDIWLAIVLGHLTRCVLTVLRFRQGRWRHIKVEIEGARA